MRSFLQRFKYRMAIALVLCFALIITLLIYTYSSITTLLGANSWVDQTYKELQTTGETISAISLAESSSRGYIIIKQDDLYDTFYTNAQKARKSVKTLYSYSEKNSEQSELVVQLDSLIDAKLDFMAHAIDIADRHGRDSALAEISTGKGSELMSRVIFLLSEIQELERASLLERQRETKQAADKALYVVLLTGIITILVLLITTVMLFRYINNRLRLENELRESEERYRLLIDTMAEGVLFVDTAEKIQYVNKRFCDISGYTKEELLGRSTGIMLSSEARHLIASKVMLRQQGQADQYELPLVKKNGETVWLSVSGTPVKDTKGNVIGSLGTHLDITEKKKAEERLRKTERKYQDLINHTQAFVCTHDLTGKLLSVNPAIEASLGYKSDELVGNSIRDFLTEDYKLNFDAYLDEIRANKITQGFMSLITRQGSSQVWSYRNIRVDKEKEPYVIGYAQDVTIQVKMENELRRAKKAAEESSIAKEQFMANMSHEIRTPLNAMLGFTDLLSQSPLNKEQEDFVHSIKTSSESLLSLINDILDYSKIEAGMMVLEKIQFSIPQLLGSVHQLLLQRAKQKDIQFTYICDENVPQIVLGDPVRLTQILVNLAGNAIKFTEKGSVEIRASRSKEKDNTAFIDFSIRDTGIGISPEKQALIFERFTQESSYTTRKYGGSGLGLSIAKNLVEMQGGEISVQSEPGKGSIFRFIIPYEVTSALMPHEEKNNAKLLSTGEIKLQNVNVLLAEDNELNQKLAIKVLTNFGFNVDLAENGKIAVEKVKAAEYDIILMDMQMPEMDGYEAARIIRNELKKSIPIVAMTAHAMPGEKEKCLQIGMNDYISKPFKSEALYRTIAAHVAVKQNDKEHSPANDHNDIDISYLKEMADGDNDFIREMLELFAAKIPGDLDLIEKSVAAGDHKTLSKTAHRLKPVIVYVGHTHLTEALHAMEQAASVNDEIKQHAVHIVSALRSALEKVKRLLSKLR